MVLLVVLGGGRIVRGQDGPDVRTSVWELRPYRVQVLLACDWSPAWNAARLERLARSLERQAAVEIGQPWQLRAQAASPVLRRAMLRAAEGHASRGTPLLERFSTDDKIVVALLRSSPRGQTVRSWEFDAVSGRWSGGRADAIRAWRDVDRAVFESVLASVSPLALVKKASGRGAVLRLRSALLPVRNPRRDTLLKGHVFQIGARNPAARTDSILPYTFLVVERIDDLGAVCKFVSKHSNPLGESPVGDWIAIGAQPRFRETEFTLMMTGTPAPPPLAACDIWLAGDRDEQGTFIGQADRRGRITIPSSGRVAWLRIQRGTVRMAEYPVLAGRTRSQRISTEITPAVALQAAVLADCRDDAAELLALGNAYAVRVQHREDAGRKTDAAKLRDESRTRLEAEVKTLRAEIQGRRNRIASSAKPSGKLFKQQWADLANTLNQLLESVAAPKAPDEKPDPKKPKKTP